MVCDTCCSPLHVHHLFMWVPDTKSDQMEPGALIFISGSVTTYNINHNCKIFYKEAEQKTMADMIIKEI